MLTLQFCVNYGRRAEIADASESRHRIECSGLVAAYLQWHLEHGIRSLRHVERA